MIAQITGAVQSVKVLNDLVKAARELKNFNELVAAVSEVNTRLMEAQSAALLAQEKQSFLTNRVSELEKEVMDINNWKGETQRYQLAKVGRGAFAYVLKRGMESGEPSHMLCANCFDIPKNRSCSFLTAFWVGPSQLIGFQTETSQ
jgi:hypothetical protein